jgi:diaminopimelate epimerase
VLLLSPTDEPGSVARLQIFNPDGSEAELSGNGAREAVLYLRRRGLATTDTFSIQTAAGEIRPTITSATTARLDLGRVRLRSADYPSGADDGRGELTAGAATWRFQHIQVGNPQCAIRVADIAHLDALDLPILGPGIENHELFPHRTNVSWYTPLDEHRIRARIFERGVGETSASGTGATGAAVAHVLAGGHSPVTVVLDGGELEVEVGEDLHVNLSGWAMPVFTGTLADDFVKELHETE